ncbi:hypothetical protein H9Q13_15065 [Pontibacter sp. JH31]|uniref:J domain-containing protein n=1 Tax=Pontibacter aquaedesilientis TaxID=2766980 RepID=A0ABR7XKL4_9BACT|nr:hypothetical protein [Pontibacter aquaedesilientis]MBD1398491.1 hypothetical protein [Pontibacter aquaedesilientis]
MEELTTSIIQKVKDELKITEELSSTELYDMLHKYRSSQHPDKFLDKERKKAAEEKFKRLNSLLIELANLIEQEKQQKLPSEIIPYKKEYEIIKNKQQIINYEEIIAELRVKNEFNENHIANLQKDLLKIQGNKADEKASKLIELYKPSKKSLISQGITFVLTFVIGVFTKVEEVAAVIGKYFPFEPQLLNYAIFGILVFIPVRLFKMHLEESKIEDISKRIRTPYFINKFYKYLNNNDIDDNFTEMNVFDFLSNGLSPKNILSKFWNIHFLNIYNEPVIDSLKDIFIFNLLNKQLVTISSANNLDRRFKIAKTRHYTSADFDLDDIDF